MTAAGKGLLGQASLWAAQIPWWGCTLTAWVPAHAAFSYHEKKKNKKTHKAPGLGSRFWGFLKYFTCAVLSDGWHPLQSWFLFEMKSPHGYDPERNKNQGQEYLGCQGHGVSSRELALLQLVFSSPTLPSFLEPLDKLRTRYYFQNLGENGKQINLLFSFLTSTDKCQPLIPMPKIIRNVLSQTCKVRMT